MITDQDYNYVSPAGREYIIAAARFAAVNPSSRVLVLGCGGGEGAVTLAREFRCKVLAADTRQGMAGEARALCEARSVGHLVTVEDYDPFDTDRSDDPFDLIIAEGGFLKPSLRKTFFEKIPAWLRPRGWLAFADKIYTAAQPPTPVQSVYGEAKKRTLCEEDYRGMVKSSGLDLQYIGMSPPGNWDNYYGHMAKRMAGSGGCFGAEPVKTALRSEINMFYKMDCLRFIGYLLCICRKAS